MNSLHLRRVKLPFDGSERTAVFGRGDQYQILPTRRFRRWRAGPTLGHRDVSDAVPATTISGLVGVTVSEIEQTGNPSGGRLEGIFEKVCSFPVEQEWLMSDASRSKQHNCWYL